LFLTGNSKEDYQGYKQPKKISLPCWSERKWIKILFHGHVPDNPPSGPNLPTNVGCVAKTS
jgi:hypothetical protein